MTIKGVSGFKVACTDIERSVAFYRCAGFEPAGPVSASAHAWLADLYGVSDPRVKSLAMVRADDPKSPRMELLEWAERAEGAKGASAAGSAMLILRSDDLQGDCAALEAAGGTVVSAPVSLPAPAGVTWLVNVRDPDGFGVQLVQFVRAG
jgi:predicted enzyme related to lactoylglutathione lyase